jgi:3-deoxy-manno-octulosonate cytidylyltransferase (CMP-KDO synthetase)
LTLAALVVIPARFASTRFPAKMLASDTGRPLVQHVVDQARKARRAERVVVAADDQRIADALRAGEVQCIMTRPELPSGTDRVAEAARQMGEKFDVIVNVQGDEPEIDPATIDALIEYLEKDSAACEMATAAAPFPADADVADPNMVKVAIAPDGRAVYFSRSPIPHRREPADPNNAPYYLHQGVYAYRRRLLLSLAGWPPTPLEKTEKLEQLRVLENGRSIFVIKIPQAVNGIDTPGQYADFVRRWKSQH